MKASHNPPKPTQTQSMLASGSKWNGSIFKRGDLWNVIYETVCECFYGISYTQHPVVCHPHPHANSKKREDYESCRKIEEILDFVR